ncbi:MAG: adenylate/guanylate cyclase domain-containing protein [Candidatus Portnoybacteria bacterium]
MISFLVGIFVSLLFYSGFFVSWRYKLTDKLFLQEEPSNEVIIIGIDNKSLQELGRWPWQRNIHAELIDRISEHKPILIGLDVNFPEKSGSLFDQRLAQSIREAGNIVLSVEAELVMKEGKLFAQEILSSIEGINQAAVESGMTNTPSDQDGVFRRVPTSVFDREGNQRRAFSLVIADLYSQKMGIDLPQIPVDEKDRMLINYSGRPGTFKTIPAIDIIEEKIEPELLKDKIVLIGATAPDLHDEQIVPSSYGRLMNGVEIHANAIETIIGGKFLSDLSPSRQILTFILLSLVLGLVLVSFKILAGSLLALLTLIVYLIISLMVFDQGIILDIFYALIIFILTYLALVGLKYLTEKKEKRKIRNTFSRYVSTDVIEEILSSPDKLKLGGEKKELSILFSDIRGFTTISEKMSPEKLVKLLNQYLTLMTDVIMDSGGVVDKYIGDAIMAFWGAPLKEPNHANKACQAALEMMEQLEKKKGDWQKEFNVDLNIGIGINTGDAIIGNMGSEKRFDYTVMGDSVNLASRLEGLNKQYQTSIIVGQFTKEKAKDDFVFEYLDKVTVKGKKQEVEIYKLIGKRG